MLITRATEYALLSLEIIKNSNIPMKVERVAKELNIPQSFLAKILQELAKNKIIDSKRGINGGFILIKKLNEIKIQDIIIASDGKKPLVFDCSQYLNNCPSQEMDKCIISPFLLNFQKAVDSFLSNLTLEDILK